MSAPTGKVFIGRETEVTREEFSDARDSPGSPGSPESFTLVSTDIMDEANNPPEAPALPARGTKSKALPKKVETLKKREHSALPVNDDNQDGMPSSSATLPAPKRARTIKDLSPAPPVRRSSRIKTAEKKVEPAHKNLRSATTKAKPASKPKTRATASTKEYEVMKIVDDRIDEVSREHLYRVRWKGFKTKDDTWEPKKNLAHCRALVQAYETQKRQKK